MTTEQKEIIELCAKAMGYEGYWLDDKFYLNGPRMWNPFTSNADGSEMESQLEIDIEWKKINPITNRLEVAAHYWKTPTSFSPSDHIHTNEPYGTDKSAARRLASCRVGAEMGRLK